MKEKLCNTCMEVKAVSEFYEKIYSRDGYRPDCRWCTKDYHAAWYAANREKRIGQMETYNLANKEQIAINRKARYLNSKLRVNDEDN